jgi:DNA repair exonuclease SbcCD nuclease subunit
MSREQDDAMATKILHTADWHLGLRFLGFGEHDRRLTQQRLATVRNILGVAERYAVDAVLVAGDVFDAPDPGEAWWGPLARELHAQPWQGRPLVLLPGNHDPLIPTSVWRNRAFRDALPAWVHIVDRDDFTLELGDAAVIHAVPCRRTAGQLDMASHLPRRAPGDNRVRIAMLHGQTFGFPGLATNFPIALDTATVGGFDYVALGDTHARRIHGPEHSPMIYPGAPEPTRFGETDAGTVTVALFGRRNRAPLLQAEPVGHYRWQERTVTTLSELRALRTEDHRQTVMRLHVAMTLAVDEHAQAETILRELEGNEAQTGKIAIATIDRSRLALDATGVLLALDDLPEQVRETARRLQAMIAAGDRADVAERALVQLYQVARQTGVA